MEKKHGRYERTIAIHSLITISVFAGLIYGGLLSPRHFGVLIALISTLLLLTTRQGSQVRNFASSPTTVISLALVTFLFPISNLTRWSILLAYSCLILLTNPGKSKSISLTSVMKIANFSMLSIFLTEVLKKVSVYSLQFFSFGYDNAFHFAMFRYFRSSTWFPFGLESKWGTDFSMFHTYPTGQAALWSFLAEPLIGNSTDALGNLAAYTFILASCFFLMAILVFRQIRPKLGGFYLVWLTPMLLSIFINITFSSILFTNGFLPYYFGLLCMLIFIDSYKSQENSVFMITSFALIVLILILVSPSIIAFFVLPAALMIVLEMKKMLLSNQYASLAISIALGVMILLLILWIEKRTTSTYGWRQILAPGGVRKPSIVQAAVVISGSLGVLILERKKFSKDLLALVSFSGLVSVGILTSLTEVYTGSIQYYAVKQAYASLAVSAIVICRYLLHKKILNHLSVTSILITSLILILPNIVPRALNSGYMGGLTGVASHTLRRGNWGTEVVDASRIFASFSEVSQEEKGPVCLIFRISAFDSDLNSRWLNSLIQKPNITNNCFAGFWNSGSLSMDQLIIKLGSLPSSFLVVIDPIQAEQFPKSLPGNVNKMVID